jgi:hypothetical protein
VFENRVRTSIFGSKREEATEEWEKNHIIMIFKLYAPHKILFG